MELNRSTDFALRTLMTLAARDGSPIGVPQLAVYHDISAHHLHKVVQKLAKLGFVTTLRGRGGGVTLAALPVDISVGLVVRQMEVFGLVDCLNSRSATCKFDGCCGLKSALGRAQNAFLGELDALSLEDITRPLADLPSPLPLGTTQP